MYKPTIRYDKDGLAYVTEEGKLKGVSVHWIDNARNAGSTYATDGYPYPFRIVLHQIQGTANPSSIAGHSYPPHIWYSAKRRTLYQTVKLSRGAFALYQAPNAPYLTNRARALQVELEGYSTSDRKEADWELQNIAEDVIVPLVMWAPEINLNIIPDPWNIPGSAREDAPQRFLPETWANWPGLCTHANVPMGDDHWDTGALDIWYIAKHAKLLFLIDKPAEPLLQEVNIMPDYFYQNTADGTIYAVFPGGEWDDRYGWDEINALLSTFPDKMKMLKGNGALNAGRRIY